VTGPGPAETRAAVITRPADLSQELIGQVAAGRGLTLAPPLLDAVQRQCERAARRWPRRPVRVNTGMGALSGVALTDGQQRAPAEPDAGPGVGGRPGCRPATCGDLRRPAADVPERRRRGVAALCQRLADMLNAAGARDTTWRGGAPGDHPLAHAFGPLVGIGSLLATSGGIRTR
jgi:histidine ammonia-lyase